MPEHDPESDETPDRLDPVPVQERRGRGRRTALVVGGLVTLAVVAGGAWAATWFLGTGPQPAEALPADTVAYAGIDLDPSGEQKLDALETLREFPAFREQLGIGADEDLRRLFVTELLGSCEGFDYDEIVEPWLGKRAAVAAVDTGEEIPAVTFVVQVTDAEAAESGFASMMGCGTSGEAGAVAEGEQQVAGIVTEGEWAVIAETEEIARGITEDAAGGSLAADETYQRWTGALDEPGVLNVYAAPEAGTALVSVLDQLPLGLLGLPSAMPSEYSDASGAAALGGLGGAGLVPDDLREQLADFAGMAAALRFDDGGVELEVVGDVGEQAQQLYAGDGEALATVGALPEATAAALGVDPADGWVRALAEQLAPILGASDGEALLAQLEQQSGLQLPEDAATLAGDSFAVAVGGDFSLEQASNSADGSDVPVGLRITGDTGAIESILDRLRERIGGNAEQVLGSVAGEDAVVVSPNPEYRDELAGDGGLGGSDVFEDVVVQPDRASAILYLNFDAGDGWLADLLRSVVGDVPGVTENVEPLQGLGLSAWSEDGAGHTVLRLATD